MILDGLYKRLSGTESVDILKGGGHKIETAIDLMIRDYMKTEKPVEKKKVPLGKNYPRT
jgi:hypothetical protein